MAASIVQATQILLELEYAERKMALAGPGAEQFDKFEPEYRQTDSIQNEIIRETMTKAQGLKAIEFLITQVDVFYNLYCIMSFK